MRAHAEYIVGMKNEATQPTAKHEDRCKACKAGMFCFDLYLAECWRLAKVNGLPSQAPSKKVLDTERTHA